VRIRNPCPKPIPERLIMEGLFYLQATRDFAMYARLSPGNAVLNGVSKRWCRSDTFSRIYP
jgi:hypothetical protein